MPGSAIAFGYRCPTRPVPTSGTLRRRVPAAGEPLERHGRAAARRPSYLLTPAELKTNYARVGSPPVARQEGDWTPDARGDLRRARAGTAEGWAASRVRRVPGNTPGRAQGVARTEGPRRRARRFRRGPALAPCVADLKRVKPGRLAAPECELPSRRWVSRRSARRTAGDHTPLPGFDDV